MRVNSAEDPSNWVAFQDHWSRILADDGIVTQAILLDQEVVGHVGTFEVGRAGSHLLDCP
ncbi:MAG: hypothetical protein ACYCOU_26015 [Sulfobacillus sp.]